MDRFLSNPILYKEEKTGYRKPCGTEHWWAIKFWHLFIYFLFSLYIILFTEIKFVRGPNSFDSWKKYRYKILWHTPFNYALLFCKKVISKNYSGMYIYTWRGGIYWTHTSQLLTEQRTLNKETVGREKVYSNIKKLFMFINNKLRVLRTFFCN